MSDYGHLTRRDFVRDSAIGALALGVGISAGPPTFAAEAGAGKSLVALVRDEKVLGEDHKADPDILKKMLDEAIKSVTGESSAAAGWKKLIKPDDVVGLVPTKAVNPTHDELVKAVTAALQEAGVAADRIQNVQGKKDAVEKCTALISMPALKVHSLTGLGTVMKNYITFSGKASSYHKENNGKLGEIWQMPAVKGKTRLILVDALQPLFERGPKADPKYLWHYNGLMASADPVAAEAISLAIIMAKRKAFKGGETWELAPAPLCVAAADKEFNLGNSDPAKIAVKMTGWEKDALISA